MGFLTPPSALTARRSAGESYQRTVVWDAASGSELFGLPLSRHVDFSPDGKTLLTDGILWDSSTGVQHKAVPYPGKPTAARFSHDGRYAVLGTEEGLTLVWDVGTGKEVARLSHDGAVRSAVFSPDDSSVFTSSGGDEAQMGMIRRWLWQGPQARRVCSMSLRTTNSPMSSRATG